MVINICFFAGFLLLFNKVVGLQLRHQGRGLYGPRVKSDQIESYDAPRKPFFDIIPFDEETGFGGRNITTVEGGRAIMTCAVKNLSWNTTVSWIRKAVHPVVLSVGPHIFTTDRRMSILTPGSSTTGGASRSPNVKRSSEIYQLVIDPVQEKDEALYECQLNTMDKLSMVFKLNVEPARARLESESALYVKVGSTISLTCSINLYSVPPPSIEWYHGKRLLNFDSPRGGISLETEKTRTGTISRLLVTRASHADNGNYTCMPSRGQPVSASVHIITDEQQYELKDGKNRGFRTNRFGLHLFLLVLLVPVRMDIV